MNWQLEALIGSDVYNLSDGTLSWIQAFDGFGAAPLHDIEERAPTQDGSTYVGYRFDPRVAQLVLGTKSDTEAGLEANLAQLMHIFAASHGQITLRFTLPSGNVRQIDVKRVGEMMLSTADKVGTYWKVLETLKAHDPIVYDPNENAVNFGLAVATHEFDIPLMIPWFIGGSLLDQTTAVTNTGTVASYPVIRIIGPITAAHIHNLTTDEQLTFTGITIAAGHYYDIDCRFGHKTILLDGVTNKIADLDETVSDLATFHLGADSEATGGINSINVTGTSATGATQVYMRWYTRYESLWG